MNNDEALLSDELMDFLREIMNVGAGNAATALSQLLNCQVDVKIPSVRILSTLKLVTIFEDPAFPVACVKMSLVGDMRGMLLFVLPEKNKADIIRLAEKAVTGKTTKDSGQDLSALSEIGNIVAGVYLTSIHDFCKLNIYHSVPSLAIDMVHAVVEEVIADMSRLTTSMIVIENEFEIVGKKIKAFLLIIPPVEFIKILTDAMKKALPGQ